MTGAAAGPGWPVLAAAIDALAPEAPAAVARGRAALHATLAPLDASAWPEVAWRFSEIAPGGFPAELVWRPRRPGLFWTAEVAPPEAPPQARLAAALARLAALGSPALPEAAQALARRTLALSGQRSCVWLGGRHDAEGDRFKLYLSTPEAAEALLPGAGAWRPHGTAGLRLFHLGLDPQGCVELYWRRRRHEPGDLAALGRAAGLERAAARLREGLAALCGRDPDPALEGRRLAYSLQLDPGGAPSALALFSALPSSALGGAAHVLGWLEGDAGTAGARAPAALWRQGRLAPSWLGVTATADGLAWHAGLLVWRDAGTLAHN